MGFARGMGIKCFVPEQSAMCKANYVYGYTDAPEAGHLDPVIKYIEDKANVSENITAKATQDAHTFHGAMQFADLVQQWITEGKDVAAEAKTKKEDLEKRFKNAEMAMHSMRGQAEAFKTTVVWMKHHARGGSLNA